MEPEGSGKHIYDPGNFLEKTIGEKASGFIRNYINVVSKLHDWQNSWGYNELGFYVSGGQLYNTGFQAYSMLGMVPAGIMTSAVLTVSNPAAQPQIVYLDR